MKTAILAFMVGAGALAVAVLAWAPAEEHTRPTRSDCIAGAELLWGGEKEDRVRVLNQIGDVFGATREYPIGGQGIRKRERIYIIFTRDCAMKTEMMDQIMTIYRQNIPSFPDYRLLEGPIEPSTKTVEAYGDEWSDGEMPPGLMDSEGHGQPDITR